MSEKEKTVKEIIADKLSEDIGYLVMFNDGNMFVSGLTTRELCYFSHLIQTTIHTQLFNGNKQLRESLEKSVKSNLKDNRNDD